MNALIALACAISPGLLFCLPLKIFLLLKNKMKLLKSSILLKLAECSWRDRWEAIQEKHNERNQNQPRLDHLCIAKLKTFLDENQTEGTWECDDLYQPSTEYQCVNRCHADGKVSGLVKVMCRFAGPVLRVGGYVDCPSIISDEEARFITSRRDKCEDNLITITNGSLKFLKTRGATTEYNIFCDGKGKSKIRAKCDEVKPNGHPKKWKFTKGSNAQKACPGGGSTGGGKKKPNHCKDVAFLNANRPLGAGQWTCDGTTKASVCRAVCSDENLTADVRIRCFKTNISYLKGDENVRCEPAEEVVFSPLSPMPLLRNCNGIRESTNSSKMPWVTELTIDSDRKCRATAINDKWLITAATCCLNAESVTMPSGAAASDVHVNGFYGDITDGTKRNFDFCLVRFDEHGLAVPCRSSKPSPGKTCWTYAEDGSAQPINHLGEDYCSAKSVVKLAPSELCYGFPDLNNNGMTDAISRDLIPGTPIFCNEDGKAALVGVGSLVETCHIENFPAIYGDINEQLVSDWIDSKL